MTIVISSEHIWLFVNERSFRANDIYPINCKCEPPLLPVGSLVLAINFRITSYENL